MLKNNQTKDSEDWNPLNGCLVFCSLKTGWTIFVYPKEDLEPFFLLFDKPYPEDSKVAAISLLKPAYINIPLEVHEKQWILNGEEKISIYNLLKKQDKHPKFTNAVQSIWKSVLECYNNEVWPEDRQIDENLIMPNYIGLSEV